MKKLDKNGFTLVELLAVIVILGLLIIIVMNTALPAMNQAKTKALNTYASRVIEKVKEQCMAESIAQSSIPNTTNLGDPGNATLKSKCSNVNVTTIMPNKTYSGTVSVTSTDGVTYTASTTTGIKDDSGNIACIKDGIVETKAGTSCSS